MTVLGEIIAESWCQKAPQVYGGPGYHCDHPTSSGKICCYCGRKVEPPKHGPFRPALPMPSSGEKR